MKIHSIRRTNLLRTYCERFVASLMFDKKSSAIVMHSILKLEIYRGIKYTVFVLNTAVYRLAVLTISTLPTNYNLLSFVHCC